MTGIRRLTYCPERAKHNPRMVTKKCTVLRNGVQSIENVHFIKRGKNLIHVYNNNPNIAVKEKSMIGADSYTAVYKAVEYFKNNLSQIEKKYMSEVDWLKYRAMRKKEVKKAKKEWDKFKPIWIETKEYRETGKFP